MTTDTRWIPHGKHYDANLVITHDHAKKLAKVNVFGKLTFSEYELNEMRKGLKFKCKCELWGDDDGLTGADDKLFTLTPKYYPDLTPNLVEDVKFELTVGEGVLDEDWGTDEVYARLRLQILYTLNEVTMSTNVVKHWF